MTTLELIGVHSNISNLVIYSFKAPDGNTFDLMTSAEEASSLGLDRVKTVCVEEDRLNIDVPLISANDVADIVDLIPEDHDQIEHVIAAGDGFTTTMIDAD